MGPKSDHCVTEVIRSDGHGFAAALTEPEILTALDLIVKVSFGLWRGARLIDQEKAAAVEIAELVIARRISTFGDHDVIVQTKLSPVTVEREN